MVSLLTKFLANIVSKYEELTAKQNELEKLINHISMLMNMNEILVQKVTSSGGGGGG